MLYQLLIMQKIYSAVFVLLFNHQ